MTFAARTHASLLGALALGLCSAPGAAGALAAVKKEPDAPEIVAVKLDELLAAVRAPGARAVLVNLWALWCEPCREEMPALVRFYKERKARGLRLLLLCTDSPNEQREARAFLAAQGVDFRSFLKVGEDMTFIDALDPRWDGTLPASFAFDAAGKRLHSFYGKVTYEELVERVDPALGKQPRRKRRNP